MLDRMPNRRELLAGCVGVFSATSAGCVGTLGDDSNSGMSSVGVESTEWDGVTLIIQFDPSFDDWDGWVIHHEYEDPGEYRVVGGEYPRVDEPQRIPFAQLLQESLQDTYSTTTFEITTFNGLADPWDDELGPGVVAWSEFGNSISFDAPDRVLEEAGISPQS